MTEHKKKKDVPCKENPEDKDTSSWIIREVSFATYKAQDEINATRLKESLSLLAKGVEEWNSYREGHPGFKPYLRNANLSWTNKHLPEDLGNINFSGADMQDADLTGRALDSADFTGANLRRCMLVDTGLSEANLDDSYLYGANFEEAHLNFATLNGADLTFANFSDAEMWNASFQGAKLRLATLDRAEAGGLLAMGADLSKARLLETDLNDADLSNADLSYALLVGTRLKGANLRGARVYGASAWDIDGEGADQSGLIINKEDEPPILVDDLEVAQFVYSILNHQKLRNAINAVSERGVLLLGRFKEGGYELLQAVAAKMRDARYLPMIFDFDRPDNRNYTETVRTLAGLARFVVVDLSGPSVPQELAATVPHLKIPFVLIIQKGREPYSMVKDILEYPWVIRPIVEFDNEAELIKVLTAKIIRPAEKRLIQRQMMLKELFEAR